MSTLADEFLQEFEDSGSDAGGDDLGDDFLSNGPLSNGEHTNGDAPMDDSRAENDGEQNGDGIADDDYDDDDFMMGGGEPSLDNSNIDPEETKARVEKLQFGDVNDVRTVASLMKTLAPVLEVCTRSYFPNVPRMREKVAATSLASTVLIIRRKLHITRRSPHNPHPLTSVLSKTTPNTTSSHNQTVFRPRSIAKSSSSTSGFEITTRCGSQSWKP